MKWRFGRLGTTNAATLLVNFLFALRAEDDSAYYTHLEVRLLVFAVVWVIAAAFIYTCFTETRGRRLYR